MPSWFEPYLGMEQAARLIRCFETQFVPGLLQTHDHARAVLRLADTLPYRDVLNSLATEAQDPAASTETMRRQLNEL